ncbi:MAG: hypothetical protein JRI23_25160, partial [Deltaproteobacteria bacterium]|nr:hypothetical protein [Deltaproteobacteria bacterium]MBW2535306.1 hypothetical protein [Deltaproteobacteria bacterium]
MRFAALLCCCLMLGCSSSAVVRSAESDDGDTFRRRLSALLAQETLDRSDAQEVALAIMRRDIAESRGRADLSGLAELADCAENLDDALTERAAQADDIGALACLIRIEAGLAEPEAYAEQVTAETALWRAVGARGLVLAEPAGPHDGERGRRLAEHGRWRRKLMADPSTMVRRAALRAAA